MRKEINKIPQLRFPEFKGEWKIERLGEISSFSKGKGISKSDIIEDGEFECIRYGELYTTYSEIIDSVKSATNIDKSKLIFSKKNDVIIPASGESQIDIATASCVIRCKIALGGDLNIIRTSTNGIFLAYYLNNKKRYDIARLAQGISVIHLYSIHLKILKLMIPSPKEQTKIANFLTTVDEKIEQISQKKELLEKFKKGVMQQLFLQKDEINPRLRFKQDDGREFEGWKEKKLKDVFNNRSSKGDSSYELLSVTMNDGVKKRSDLEGKDNSNNDKSNYKIVRSGDIVYNSMRMWQGASGVSQYDGIVSPAYTVLNPKPNNDSDFWGYYFKTPRMIHNFMRNSQGLTSDTWNLKYPQLSTIKVYSPTIDEQLKIVTFLRTLDKKIENVENQLKQMQEWKKGLLQKMFV